MTKLLKKQAIVMMGVLITSLIFTTGSTVADKQEPIMLDSGPQPDITSNDDNHILSFENSIDVNPVPNYIIPGEEIKYDEGTMEAGITKTKAGGRFAVRMSLPEDVDSAIVESGLFAFQKPIAGDETYFEAEVWDASGEDGFPGEILAGPVPAEAEYGEWTVVNFNEENIQVDGDFYIVFLQKQGVFSSPVLGVNRTGLFSWRNYDKTVDKEWQQEDQAIIGNYMIRARIGYEVPEPEITNLEHESITNQSSITIEGNAYSNDDVDSKVKILNNGVKSNLVDVTDEGTFTGSVELSEGENNLTIISVINGEDTSVSEPITVKLDTKNPELVVESPSNGDRTNRETVTVEGIVRDDNLEGVTVNGQTADITKNRYSKRIILDNGQNTIEVVATDDAGNETTESLTIDVKYDAPEIDNLTPDEDLNLETGESVKIEFDSERGLKSTFSVHMPLTNNKNRIANATELPMMEKPDGHYVGYWTVPQGVEASGAVVEVKAVDDFNNETRKEAQGKLFTNQ